MTTELVREITKLNKLINFKLTTLSERIEQLEGDFTSLSLVTGLVALLTFPPKPICYTVEPKNCKPVYIAPPLCD